LELSEEIRKYPSEPGGGRKSRGGKGVGEKIVGENGVAT